MSVARSAAVEEAVPKPTRARTRLLLVEPYFVLRRTVVSVASSLGVAEVVEAATLDAGLDKLLTLPFDGAVVALGDDGAGLDLIHQIRAGKTRSPITCAVAVMAERCDAAAIARFQQLDVKRVVLKPFKVKTILDTVKALCASCEQKMPCGQPRRG